MLKLNVGTPLYIQISTTLKNEILNGIYPDGGFFPSETELTKRFSVTRVTIRNAVNILVQEGLLHKQQGKRITVSLNKIKITSWNFRSFNDGIRSQHSEPISKVISFSKTFIEGKQYYELIRIRGIKQGESCQYLSKEISNVPCELFPELERFDFSVESLYEVMRKQYNIYPCNGSSSLQALVADNELCDYFAIPYGSAIIKATQVITDNLQRIIELVEIYHSPFLELKISRDIGH